MPPNLDEPIDGSEVLLRRIGADWITTAEDGSTIIASAAFLDNIDGNVSVHIASLTSQEQVLAAYPFCRLAAIEARIVQGCGFSVIRDPLPEDPSHAVLRPPAGYRSKNKRKADARLIARSARLLD